MTAKDIIICGHGWGTPRTTDLYTYAASRYAQKAPNGVRKGIVCVKRLKSLTDEGRKKFRDTYRTILGRNLYDQDLRSYVYTAYRNGKYYSDCSSSVCATFAKIGYGVSLLNTAGIYRSSLFETVPVTVSGGQITDPEKLKVGDCILFAGDDPSRPLQIGHVEAVYEMPAQETEEQNGTAGKCADTVAAFQAFLNTYYSTVVRKAVGSALSADGVYGPATRAGALAVWKYMANKYYGADLTIGNHNFYSACRAAAKKMTEAETAKHATLVVILQGILAGRGMYSGKLDPGTINRDTKTAVRLLTGSGTVDAAMWSKLFN